ncbi:MAG: hypothetical protein GY765_13470 [bacterium]|nr:hypothetical protein [bacterium]
MKTISVFTYCTVPGLKSRFTRVFGFEDFKPPELVGIFHIFAKKGGFTVSEEASARLLSLFSGAYSRRDRYFGNGRFVRSIFEKIMQAQAMRLGTMDPAAITGEALSTITVDDVEGSREKAK